ncbi:MAG: tRNA threonylcarbamoyladenosine dehydratase [Treponema sp.]|nr:tRNA threonylcarbamoyladenosine dehydratase [Treponema sp.]
MESQFSRTELLLGTDAIDKIKKSHIAIFGIGGVGGYAAEALARSGIGEFDLIDSDTVALSNLNRQIIALHSTINRPKVDVMKERILDINPSAKVNAIKCFYLPENKDDFDFLKYDYVVDAVDTVTAKLLIITQAKTAGVPVISCMGAGNKLNPAAFEVADIYKTSVCPLARVMRQECKKRSIKDLKVVYSKEKPVIKTDSAPGSCSFVPSVAGLIIAGEVIKDLLAL